ncbi:MAG: isoprenylcysteine carboxylmethyltransferase family protein [Gemmatimonadetes bacterium]|nr:isoprenylcysteine carboxylmethyltransferase family protein [Gemmatimonadota bacterium]
MNVTLRWIRLRLAWLLVPPFFYFARPTLPLLAAGLALAVAGATLRAWAAGVIRKDRALAVTGPYAHTRNPLYLGSCLIGLGLAIASGRVEFVILFVALFALVYGRAMRVEAEALEKEFGDAYRGYARTVPTFLPRLRPYRPEAVGAAEVAGSRGGGFDFRRYLGNREYQTAVGLLAGFGILAVLVR